ncbi:E6 protein [Okapia johnstoni papillomavirus 1]|uniref:Protein E6 n=1 Tax=Okapia johnstoni papillomavirus 1 TaxID=2304449 RepID=A0A346LUY1_9PAPI|nr:E6 protein [Okapia johnstoni papillomavirus 1]
MGLMSIKVHTALCSHMDANPKRKHRSVNEFQGLRCLWCKVDLSAVDAYRCKVKLCTPVFRRGERYGACTSCLETFLTLERVCYACSHVTAEDVYAETNVHTENLRIRCYYCGGCLTPNEKHRHETLGEPYCKIRGIIRGRCYLCAQDNARPIHNEKPASR